MDLVHMATCSIHWAILWSTESNKSSRWSLMDLVHMATCSIHWAILWSTESKSSTWLHALFTGLYCGVLNPTKAAGSLMDLVHMATCSIHWAILWSTESINIRQNQDNEFGGFGVVRVKLQYFKRSYYLGQYVSLLYIYIVAERSSLPDSSSGVSSRIWVRIPAVTLVSLSKTLNHNCFSPPRG